MLDSSVKDRLLEMYGEPWRRYHGVSHLRALLSLAHDHSGILRDREAVEAAIWFHDAVMDTRRNDSESRSAELARNWLRGGADASGIEAVATMIEATAGHVIPAGISLAERADMEAFLDMDLAILGADQVEFDGYEAGVREEYGWATDEQWTSGRAAVLRSFLDRPTIYGTDRFRGLYEAKARENISGSLAKLDAALRDAGRRPTIPF